MHIFFPIAQVETFIWLPPLVAFFLAYFGAMGGVTGAFLLLPFQMSVLGYTSPGVSGTNFTYNIIAIPGTVFRYAQEGRMNWPLAAVIVLGSCPGIVLGYLLRIRYLADPADFKPFAGLVLLYLAWLMGRKIFGAAGGPAAPPCKSAQIKTGHVGLARISYEFDGQKISFAPLPLFSLATIVGVVGGAYGIGGGAVLAPFCISVLRLPVHSVAGASLFGTFMCSVVGVLVYHFGFFSGGLETRPDYLLGAFFGLGGALGGYLGAKTQRHIPEQPIKVGLFVVLLIVACRYLLTAL
ncbi:MAG: sulfite exporter TauE/SafE family protein [Desulfobulbaceae bacterium]|nr:sulfite exporter TauE/SafE family protein [Desulfobulbaceae bacterium]HIJ78480.1 sulfite exporter TauE/SafE family protein [Deltaproteobacteria bacterium]